MAPQISFEGKAATSYEVEAYSSITIELSEDTSSLFIIEIGVYQEGIPYNVNITNQMDILKASRLNYTKNLILSFIGAEVYDLEISNPNSQSMDFSVKVDSFSLVVNNEIDGYSHRNKIFCWSFDTGSIVDYKVFNITSLKRGYYNLYNSIADEDITTLVWLSQLNPSSGPGWNDNLDSKTLPINSKRLVDLETSEQWLVIDINSVENHEVIIVLQSTIPGNSVIIIVGICAAVLGVIIFVLYYLNPLKYRKRRVQGKDYGTVKHEFEQPDDIGDIISDIVTDSDTKK
jgi:hypothetical protein